jgi:hypothetical protein
MNELEREKRNSQRQECSRPKNRIPCARSKNQSGQKIPVFEGDQKDDGLRDTHETKWRAFAIKSAENAFPGKNEKATSAGNTPDLNQRKENKKSRAENQANPWLRGWPHEAEEDRGGHEKQEKVCECIKDHALPLC